MSVRHPRAAPPACCSYPYRSSTCGTLACGTCSTYATRMLHAMRHARQAAASAAPWQRRRLTAAAVQLDARDVSAPRHLIQQRAAPIASTGSARLPNPLQRRWLAKLHSFASYIAPIAGEFTPLDALIAEMSRRAAELRARYICGTRRFARSLSDRPVNVSETGRLTAFSPLEACTCSQVRSESAAGIIQSARPNRARADRLIRACKIARKL